VTKREDSFRMKLVVMSVHKCILLAVLLAVLGETYAWRPQGRFGKRRLSDDLDIPHQDMSIDRHLASRDFQDPDRDMFRFEDIICMRKGPHELYKCLQIRPVSDEGAGSQ